MPRKRSKDALTAATTDYLKPFLIDNGFIQHSKRQFLRIEDEVVQFLSLNLSSWGSRRFCVEYASQLLIVPRETFVIDLGGRLTAENAKRWWPSKTHEEADSSMRQIVSLADEHVLSHFEETRSVAGFSRKINSFRNRWNFYYEQDRASCFARLGMRWRAKRSARKVINKYRAVRPELVTEHTTKVIHNMEDLIIALEEGSERSLLNEWKRFSGRSLGIEDLIN